MSGDEIWLQQPLQRKQQLYSSSLHSEVVVFDDARGAYFGLNPIGSAIWALLATPTRFEDLTSALRARYDVSEERCYQEVVAFLKHLRDKGLLEVISSAG